ncbi:translation initiation factor [Aureicoccus marinus]|jgi:translation initiation factor 1|uniref:Translation initiation factor SUI1-related protein n=1 Tax=Aureicoccus marinus TaxID=754435 RepID=A0A2S7T5Z2_9FLAO|nr:translation initiation factor [Aureicoccus marinus]PQJ14991.1 translation initiation factor SUI1-related protein [Aureicoccus marinus]
MDLEDQLRQLFPDHEPEKEQDNKVSSPDFWLQDDPLLCKYEKRKGKPQTIIAGYNGADKDFKALAKALKKYLHVGGGIKNEEIIIQGDYRDQIMDFLQKSGFAVKRVGG